MNKKELTLETYKQLKAGDLIEFHEIYTGLGETDIVIGMLLEPPNNETLEIKILIIQDTFANSKHIGKTTLLSYNPADNNEVIASGGGYKSKVFLLA
jgi:hypothetical protein